MRCHICGGKMVPIKTDLPFKTHRQSIVIFKNLPVYQCENCIEYMLDDAIMENIDHILENMGDAVELEIVKYAA